MSRTRAPRVLWVSTSTTTRGGIATCVATLGRTPLWRRWGVTHVATHRDGPATTKVTTFLRGLARIAVLLVVRRPDLVHLHTSSDGSFVRKATVFWLARALGVRCVLHVHSGRFHLFHERSPWPLRRLIAATLAAAETVVALGEVWVDRLHAIAPTARVVVVPNPVTVPEVAPLRPAAPVRVAFLGRIWDKKGAFTLVEAWAKALSSPEVDRLAERPQLVMAGDGEGDRARDLVADLGLADSVTVHDWIPAEDAAALLDASHVLVLPSLNEGQPMVVLEAMARATVPLATRVGGIPEIVDDGHDGVLVAPGDPEGLRRELVRLLTDPDERGRLAAAARDRAAEGYAVDVVWRRLDALYAELLGR